MKYYYLISGKLYWANSEMPKLTMYSPFYDSEIMILKDSLQPCEITERDLNRIINRFKTFDYSNPINVTDLVNDDNGVVTFKHPKQVDESLQDIIWQKFYDEVKPLLEKYNLNNIDSCFLIKVISMAGYAPPVKQVDEASEAVDELIQLFETEFCDSKEDYKKLLMSKFTITRNI